METDIKKFVDFVTSGYEKDYQWEVRTITPSGNVQTKFFNMGENLINWIKSHYDEKNTYMGILPRKEKDGHASSIEYGNMFFVDFDSVDSFKDVDDIIGRLGKFGILPSMVIKSCDKKIHIYYKVKEQISPEPWKKIQEGMFLFFDEKFKRYEPDRVVKDLPRIMRVAGTKNYKYDPPEDSSIYFDNFTVYPIKDLLKIIGNYVKTNENVSNKVEKEWSGAMNVIPDNIDMMIQNGEDQNRRHKSAYIIVKELHKRGFIRGDIRKLLLTFNKNCRPPKPEEVVLRHVDYLLDNKEEYLKETVDSVWLTKNKYGIPDGDDDYIDFNHFFELEGKKKKFRPMWLADYLKKKKHYMTPEDSKELYIYDKGIYKPYGEVVISKSVRSLLGKVCQINHVNEVISAIKQTTFVKREDIDDTKNTIVIANGILNVETLEIEPHTHERIYTTKVNVEWKPDATCEIWKKWLHETLVRGSNEEDVSWKMDTIQEMFGYCLLMDVRYQKAFMLYGQPRSGKSTLINVLNILMGSDNVGAISLQYLTENRFATSMIWNKRVNSFADLSSKSLKDVSKFMMITGNDPLTAEQKGRDGFTFKPVTKLIFSCNVIPRTSNKNMAFYRRWIIIDFPKSIPENEADDVWNSEASPLITAKELSGILNWAIEGLRRLLKNKKFSYPYGVEQVKDMYQRGSDSISSFIMNCIEEDDDSRVKKRNVYKEYVKYCEKERLDISNVIAFGRVFKEETGCGITKIDNIPAYAGVRLSNIKTEVQTLL